MENILEEKQNDFEDFKQQINNINEQLQEKSDNLVHLQEQKIIEDQKIQLEKQKMEKQLVNYQNYEQQSQDLIRAKEIEIQQQTSLVQELQGKIEALKQNLKEVEEKNEQLLKLLNKEIGRQAGDFKDRTLQILNNSRRNNSANQSFNNSYNVINNNILNKSSNKFNTTNTSPLIDSYKKEKSYESKFIGSNANSIKKNTEKNDENIFQDLKEYSFEQNNEQINNKYLKNEQKDIVQSQNNEQNKIIQNQKKTMDTSAMKLMNLLNLSDNKQQNNTTQRNRSIPRSSKSPNTKYQSLQASDQKSPNFKNQSEQKNNYINQDIEIKKQKQNIQSQINNFEQSLNKLI